MRKALRLASAALLVMSLVLVCLLIWLTNFGVLNLPGLIGARNAGAITLSIFCWLTLAGFGAKLTIGSWKSYALVKQWALAYLLAIPATLVFHAMMPRDVPRWIDSLLFVSVLLAAFYLATRLIALDGSYRRSS